MMVVVFVASVSLMCSAYYEYVSERPVYMAIPKYLYIARGSLGKFYPDTLFMRFDVCNLNLALARGPYGARTVPVRCPYGARTVPNRKSQGARTFYY